MDINTLNTLSLNEIVHTINQKTQLSLGRNVIKRIEKTINKKYIVFFIHEPYRELNFSSLGTCTSHLNIILSLKMRSGEIHVNKNNNKGIPSFYNSEDNHKVLLNHIESFFGNILISHKSSSELFNDLCYFFEKYKSDFDILPYPILLNHLEFIKNSLFYNDGDDEYLKLVNRLRDMAFELSYGVDG